MGRMHNIIVTVLSSFFLFLSCQPPGSSGDRDNCKRTTGCKKHVDGFKKTQYQNVTLSVPVDGESPSTDIHVAKKTDVPWGSVEAFDFKPDNLIFPAAARLSINTDGLLLPPGVKKESLRVAALDGNSWKILPVDVFPGSSGSVTALLHHLSLYGLLPAPGETSAVGTELSLNGVSLTAAEEVHAVLRVTPGIVVAYLGQKPGRVVSIVLSGLPETGEHFMYVAGSTDPFPVVGGSASVTLALDEPKVLWVQPFRATVHIGGPDDQCSIVGYRDGTRCTLTTDLTGEISIDGDDQILDCSGHLLTQYASYPGSGIGILVSGRTGVLVENCHIGAGSAGYGDGVLVDFSSDVTVLGCEIESSDVAIELVSSSSCTVRENVVSGETREGMILRDDSFGNTVSGNSASTTVTEGTTSLALRGAIYISDIGEDIIVLVRENIIEENTFEGAGNGILFSLTGDNDIRKNDVSSTADAIRILNSEWTDRLYHNNINGEARGAYSESAPAELSYAGEGNYWGRSCPGPLFIPGEDSNRSDVVDSHAFGEPDAWDLGLPPGCGPAGDMDWDGIPDGVDNCPAVWNPGQENVDGENEGDACDVTPPEAPMITYPVHGGIYDFEIGLVQGSAELRSLVKIYEAGQVIAQGFADDAGLFSFDLAEPFSNGFHAIRAFSQDAAGNVSSPSVFVAFEISLYPPEPPMILKPAQGEIVNSPIIEVSGKAIPEELVLVFIDDAFSGSGFADAMGNFAIPSILEVGDGEHWARAQAMDGFGRMSDFSEAVTFSVFAVSTESPISGELGRLSITGISDGPDPFYPSLDTAVFHVDARMQAVEGMQGRSPSLTFSSTCSLSIRNAESGETIRILDGSVDITGAPVTGGNIAIEQDLAWDGKDASGAFVPTGEIFVYDLDMSTLKIHDNPAARCGRAPCVLDEVHVADIGTVSTTPLPRPVHRILVVSNGQYLQEQAILEHFQVINEAGEGEFFSVRVLPDYKMTGDLDLGSAHAVILTEFSPGIPADGLLNLRNAGKPILVVEHEKFNFSQYFNLVTAPGSIPAHTESIEVATHEHPATYYLGEDEKVFAGPQTAYAVPPSAIPQEIMPLLLDPASGDVIALADNANAILASGLSDTTRFSAKGWVVFDLFLNFLHPTARPWDQDPDGAMDALIGSGILDFLSDVSENPLNWSYDSTMESIWPQMLRENLILLLPEMDNLIPTILDLSTNWGLNIHRFENNVGRALLFYRSGPEYNYITECTDWFNGMTDSSDPYFIHYLPDDVYYRSSEAGGIPLLEFLADDSSIMLANTFSEDRFAVNFSNISVAIFEGSLHPFRILKFSSGTSALLDRKELYQGYFPDSFNWYWWGRKNFFFDPTSVDKQPFEFAEGESYKINLDLYKFRTGKPMDSDNLICLARLIHLWDEDDLPSLDYMPSPTDLPYSEDIEVLCEYSGGGEAFDPTAEEGGPISSLPNSFLDAVGLDDELRPRMQLMEPVNPYLNRYHPIEAWCEESDEHSDVCASLDNPANGEIFKDALGITDDDYIPSEHITPRHRADVPWAGSGDIGPWQKPHLTAGMDTLVKILVRSESESLPMDSDYYSAACKRTTGMPYSVAWLVYEDASHAVHDPANDPLYPVLIEEAQNGNLPSGSNPYTGQIVFMPCYKTVDQVEASDPYNEISANEFRGKYFLLEDEGITFSSMELPSGPSPETDWKTWKYAAIKIPPDATGPAKIIWQGKVVLKTSTIDMTAETLVDQRREFPIYIEPINETITTDALDNAKPVCWIGATRGLPPNDIDLDEGEMAPFVPPDIDFATSEYSAINPNYWQVNSWLFGGDLGTWAKVETSDGPRLYSIFGDIGINWNNPPPYTWYQYRGSTLAFFQNSAPHDWITGYSYQRCPVMLPELLEDGLPWEMVHADGVNAENAIWFNATESIYRCKETGSETTAATAAFQTKAQKDRGMGEAYIWFANVSDWGSQSGFYKNPQLLTEPVGYYNPIIPTSAYLNAYEKDPPPYYSFMAKWDSSGVDEMGRSVKWEGGSGENWGGFVVTSVISVDDLSEHIIDPEAGDLHARPGILVWHTGRYRASDIYFSYAREEDVLYPERYRHYKEMADSTYQWTDNAQEATPIIRDFVGEFSALCFPADKCTIISAGPIYKPYKVLYHITTLGQSGIVMREAQYPWGPYSKKLPLFDCFAEQRHLGDTVTIMYPEQGGSCYGGFSHPDLWDQLLLDDDDYPYYDVLMTAKFSISMWNPYKVLLAQTSWIEHRVMP